MKSHASFTAQSLHTPVAQATQRAEPSSPSSEPPHALFSPFCWLLTLCWLCLFTCLPPSWTVSPLRAQGPVQSSPTGEWVWCGGSVSADLCIMLVCAHESVWLTEVSWNLRFFSGSQKHFRTSQPFSMRLPYELSSINL